MPAPFVDQPFTFTQPDGTQIRVRGTGNQFEAVFETEDGYTVVLDADTRYHHYARRSADGSALLPTGPRVGSVDPAAAGLAPHVRAAAGSGAARAAAARQALGGERRWEERRRERRAARREAEAGLRAAPPEPTAVGDVVGLCLLVQFPDVPATINRQQVDDFCNKTGYTGFGNNGSVRDYFLEVSGGRLRYRNVVTAYYTAQHNRAYYTDPAVPYGTRAQELIREGLNHLNANGFTFGQLSADSAGFVYALNVFYAGPTVNNWSEGLWPHAWTLATPFTAGGRTLRDYQITDIGTQLTLRTYCHENGHMVCDYPDLYDYGSESYGVGNYCLMCYGGSDTNPVHVNAYLKNEAGWSASFTPVAPGTSQTVRAGANEFLVHSRSATEYFVIENRQQAGRDAHLPDAGLFVWHVDENGSNSNEQMTPTQHYELSLEQADGLFDLERKVDTGDTTDLYGTGQTFGDSTVPNSRWWDGGRSGLEIVDISAPGAVMTIKTNNPGGTLVIPNFGYSSGGWRVEKHPRTAADVSGDGRADVVGFGDAATYVARALPNGGFGPVQPAVADFGYDQGWRVERHPRLLADTNADGRADVVGFGDAGVYVSRGRADGTFAAPQLVVSNFGYSAGGWRVEKHPRFVADTTGDGRGDIVGFGEAGVYVSRAQANGTFAAPQLVVSNFGYSAGGWRVEKHPRFVADTTGDGRGDIVGFGEAGVYVSRAQANGTFAAPQLVVSNFGYSAGGWRVEKHPRFVADTTGDGRVDIVGFGDAGVYIARAQSGGGYGPVQLVVADFGYDQGWRIERHPRFLADTTGDGRADVVGFGDAGVYVARARNDGTFGPAQLLVPDFGYVAGGWRVEKHPRVLADTTGGHRADVIGFGDAGVLIHRW